MDRKVKVRYSEPSGGYSSSGEPQGYLRQEEVEYDNADYVSRLIGIYNKETSLKVKTFTMKLICSAIGEPFDPNDLPDKLPNNFGRPSVTKK